LLGEQYCDAGGFQIADRRGQLIDDHGRESLGGLVEENARRIPHEAARDREHLLLATRDPSRGPIARLSQVGEQSEHAVRAPASALPPYIEILRNGKIGEDAPVLGNIAETRARDAPHLQALDAPAVEHERAVPRRDPTDTAA